MVIRIVEVDCIDNPNILDPCEAGRGCEGEDDGEKNGEQSLCFHQN